MMRRTAIKRQNFGLTWTDADAVPRASVVSYNKASAEQRQTELEAAGSTQVRIVETKPGQVLAAQT
ncbi:hypothetical protein [Streptomyces sp. NBC_01445]|uniref:hypothetical protein n=1 Tax=Streptomyces sp. NBC_01445 TaxID=2903869 RepID=UPI002DDA2DA3|nr:hypothetical protein [Streptomyces sp. NBC_01445]WSE09937.1 hypothetical protein OG574_45315 [Streptomyces sp. NBC_01445]